MGIGSADLSRRSVHSRPDDAGAPGMFEVAIFLEHRPHVFPEDVFVLSPGAAVRTEPPKFMTAGDLWIARWRSNECEPGLSASAPGPASPEGSEV